MENFGNRCKTARNSLITSQKELAEKLNITQSDISYIETGNAKKANTEYINYLLSNGVSWKWLYEGKGEMKNINTYNNNEILSIVKEEKNEYLSNNSIELEAANKKIEFLEKFIKENMKIFFDKLDIKMKH